MWARRSCCNGHVRHDPSFLSPSILPPSFTSLSPIYLEPGGTSELEPGGASELELAGGASLELPVVIVEGAVVAVNIILIKLKVE